jgi:hypothetical protein
MISLVNAAILLFLTAFVYAQGPPNPKYDEVIESKVYPGVTISYKAVPVSAHRKCLSQSSPNEPDSS